MTSESDSLFFKIIDPNNPSDALLYENERNLRYEVMRKPLGMPKGTEEIDSEKASMHFIAVNSSGDVVGCVLFYQETPTSGRLRAMTISSSLQGKGIGTKLAEFMFDYLRKMGIVEILLHARTYAIPFYEKLGFSVFGDEFEVVGIPHRHMRGSIAKE